MAVGYAVFAASSIIPRVRAWQEVSSQLTSTERALIQAQNRQQESPGALEEKVEAAQARLNKVANVFLSESEAAEALNRLYQYASQSGVEISSLESKLAEQGDEKGLYDVRTFSVQVGGSLPNLVQFMSRIREATLKSFAIANVSVTEGEDQHALTMDTVIYTSPYAVGEALPTSSDVIPSTSEAATPTPETVTPTPEMVTLTPEPGTPTPLPANLRSLEEALSVAWAAQAWDQVIDLINLILAIDPAYDDVVEQLYAAHFNYGYQLLQRGDTAGAITQFNAALIVKPDGEEAMVWLRRAIATLVPSPTVGATPSPLPTSPSQAFVYTVRRGDTLYSLARRYGTTEQAIMAINGLTDSRIRVGQQLTIPVR